MTIEILFEICVIDNIHMIPFPKVEGMAIHEIIAFRSYGIIPEIIIPIQKLVQVKPGDISRMVDVASKLERISRGDVGEVVEERTGENATPSVTFYMPDNGRDTQEEE